MRNDAAKSAAEIRGSEDRDSLLRELDNRVRNNLSMLLSLVRFRMEYPPISATAALSRLAGQIMALSTIYDPKRDGREYGYGNAAELCAAFIEDIGRNLSPPCRIRFSAADGAAEIPIEAIRTLGVVLGEMILDSLERSSRAGRPPEINVILDCESRCRFSVKVMDTAPREEGDLLASTLARAMGGELRTTGEADSTERELLFGPADADGNRRDAAEKSPSAPPREPGDAPP